MNLNWKQILVVTFIFLPQLVLAQDNTEKTKKPAIATHRAVTNISPTTDNKLPDNLPDEILYYTKMTVSPQNFPTQLLKNRLNVYSIELDYDNAHPFYVEAKKIYDEVYYQTMRPLWQSKEYSDLRLKKEYEKISQLEFKHFPLYAQYNSKNLEATADDEANLYKNLSQVYKLLEKGSLCRYYNWSTNKHLGITTILPHIDYQRELARYLESKADWEIRNGNYTDAIKTIKVGLALGKHAKNATPVTLIGFMIGCAINQSMQKQLLHLAAQPNSPNLYLALTQLNHNDDDALTNAIDAERNFFLGEYASRDTLDNLDSASDAECKDILEKMTNTLFILSDVSNSSSKNIDNSEKKYSTTQTLAFSTLCILSYLPAKQRLRDKGLSDEKIESLSIYQVITPHLIERIQLAYDMLCIETSFKSDESHEAFKFESNNKMKWLDSNNSSPIDIYLDLFLPSAAMTKIAYQREIQTLDRLKIVEAIRYYAAVHEGNLPESLDEIKEIAVAKICPITGKPYKYKVEGKTFSIDYNSSPRPKSPIFRMEVTVK
jgi:hypothetical protein